MRKFIVTVAFAAAVLAVLGAALGAASGATRHHAVRSTYRRGYDGYRYVPALNIYLRADGSYTPAGYGGAWGTTLAGSACGGY